MKVPKLKNIRVRSRYDGMGTIEQIYTASNKSMKVNFDNGAKKSFTIPLAFNSGLLSSDNKSLSDYISFLNQMMHILPHHSQRLQYQMATFPHQ